MGIERSLVLVSALLSAGIRPTEPGASILSPIITEDARLEATPGAPFDSLGSSIALDGDTAVLGSPYPDVGPGAAYVFVRSGATWSQQAVLHPSDSLPGDAFGYAVAISGDTIVVGAYSLTSSIGVAYVFVRSGITWTQQARIEPSTYDVFEVFNSFSISGNTFVAGMGDADLGSGLVDAGAAYVYVRVGTIWSEQAKLVAPDAAASDRFGSGVAVSSNTIVSGAYRDDTGGGVHTGSAHVFVRSGTTWTHQAKLTAPGGTEADAFGAAVALDADTAVVVARGALVNGAAYVFSRTGTTWTQEAELPGPAGSAYLSESVSISGGRAVLGDREYSDYAARLFSKSGGTWVERATLRPANPEDGNNFAASVAISGTTTLVAASFDTTGAGEYAGSGYVFDLGPEDPSGLVSTTHAPGAWGAQSSVAMEWSGAFDSADNALAGYSVLFDTNPSTVPDLAVEVPQAVDPHSISSAPLPDGTSHYFHLRTCNTLGACTPGLHRGPYWVDAMAPSSVSGLVSTSHQIGVPSPDYVIAIAWTAATDNLSGIDGYSFFFDANAAAACDDAKDVEEAVTTASSPPLGPGTWYAHVCAADNAGNWSALATAGPYLIVAAADLSVLTSDSLDPVDVSQAFSYAISVTNAGPEAPAPVTVTNPLPASVGYVGAAGAGWACNESAGTVTCTLPSLAPGATAAPITIDVVAPASPGSVLSAVTVSSPLADPATADNVSSEVTVVGDTMQELVHGSTLVRDLAALPGPVADDDVYRLRQAPYSSYEVVVDAVTGDIAGASGPILERVPRAGDVQPSVPAGAGGSRALRWENASADVVDDEVVLARSAGCSSDCDVSDTYRIQLHDTTTRAARFNNSASQITVLVLENPSSSTIHGHVWLRTALGALAGDTTFSLPSQGSLAINTSAIAPATSGSITVTSDAPYGALVGKAVAVEPATGFTFDTAFESRTR